jgi:hypothetical protein
MDCDENEREPDHTIVVRFCTLLLRREHQFR